MKKGLTLLLTLLSVVLSLAQVTGSATENVVAIVNGQGIPQDLFETIADVRGLLRSISQIDLRFFNVLTETEEGLRLLLKYKMEVLKDMIDHLLIQQLAEREGVGVHDEEVLKEMENKLKQTVEELGFTLEDFDTFLQNTGYGNLESFKKRLFWSMKTQKALQNLEAKYSQNVTVTPEEVKDYYDKNKESFRIPAAVHLYRISAKEKKQMEEALMRIRRGEDFLEVARSISGEGDMGWVEEGTLRKEIERVVFDAPESAIVGPFETQDGFVLYKVIEKRPARYKTFEEVRNDIQQKLLSEKRERVWGDWFRKAFDEFKSKSIIEIKLGGASK